MRRSPIEFLVPTLLTALLAAAARGEPTAPPPPAGGDPCVGQGDAGLALVEGSAPGIGGDLDLRIEGRPLAPVTVIADIAAGPRIVPGVGTLCLDLGPRARFLVDGIRRGAPTLGDDGTLEIRSPVPRDERLVGRSIFLQAVVDDPAAPNGFAISPLLEVAVLDAVVETFRTTDFRDDDATTAEWEGTGFARGSLGPTRIVDLGIRDSFFNLAHPLVEAGNPTTPFGCRFQMRFLWPQIGAERGESIAGMDWSPRSRFAFASTYEDVEIRLGNLTPPADLFLVFDDNFDAPPTTVFDGDYAVALDRDVRWVPWPAFDRTFDHEPRSNLVFEVDLPEGGDTFQLFRNASTRTFPRNRIFANGGAERSLGQRENTQYDTRFHLVQDRAFATSRFYDTGAEDPDYGAPTLRFDPLPEGTSLRIRFEGADSLVPGGPPDPATFTGLRDSIDEIDGSRFVRFEAVLKADFRDGDPVVLRRVTIPFETED